MSVVAAARSDVGRVRQGKPNEDAYLMDDPIFAIADGMGGHIAGDVASSTAVEVIAKEAQSADPSDPSSLETIVRKANSAIYGKAQSDPSLRGMGTTCTLLMVQDSIAHLAHVGDSRAYLLRAGELSQLTEDHTLVWRMVKEGRISAGEADHHPQRNIILRALGIDSDVQVDVLSFELVAGDRLLLCSDGLSSMVDAESIRAALAESDDPQRAADRLVELANNAGGEDNITVVVVDVVDSKPVRPSPDRASTETGPMRAVNDSGRTDTPVEDQQGARMGDTFVRAAEPTPAADRRPRFWLRRVIAAVIVVGILVLVAVFVVRWQLGNSYYVGVNEEGLVTIFKGRPEAIAGISLRTQTEQTELAVEELPEFMRDDVQQGIEADSLSDAEQRVETLKTQAESFNRERGRGNGKS
jgi:PPM family protein phosphatase